MTTTAPARTYQFLSRSLQVFTIAALAWIAGCSGPLTALDPKADPAEVQRHAERQLADPDTREQARDQLAWLCLLHGTRCGGLQAAGARLDERGLPGSDLPLDRALVQALSLHGTADLGPRAAAWRTVLEVAHRDRVEPAATAAAEALQRLSVRDRSAVVAALRDRPQAAVQSVLSGPPLHRWRRTVALGELLAQAGVAVDGPPLTTPLQVRMAPNPGSRRVFTGLDDLTAPIALPDDATRAVTLPPAPGQARLPALLRTGRYRLTSPDPGLYAVRAEFEAAGPRTLIVRAPRALRVWIDGKPWPDDQTRHLRQVTGTLQLTPGRHRLDLALALTRDGEPLDLAILDGAESSSDLPTAWAPALRDVVEALLHPHDGARGRLQRTWPKALLPALLGVEAAPALDPQEAAPAAVLDKVLDLLPDHTDAWIDRTARLRESGSAQLALQRLDRLARPALVGPQEVRHVLPRGLQERADLALEQAVVLLGLGLHDEAAQVVEGLVAAQPGDCTVLRRALDLGIDAMNRPLLRRLLRPYEQSTDVAERCPDHALTVAAAWAQVGQLERSEAVLRQALAQPAQARDAAERLQDQARARGESAKDLPAWTRHPTAEAWLAAQKAALQNDAKALEARLAELLTGPGHSLEARQKALQAGATAPWQRFLRNGEELASKPDDPQLTRGAGIAWLLDQEVVVLLPGGGALRRVHQVVRVLNDEAAEAVGEVRVPDGADLEFARTLLPADTPGALGDVVLPAETADKATISLRAVSAGAAVEFAQVAYVAPDDPATGATRLGTFLLQATDGPVALSEYVVLVPQGVTATQQPSVSAPKPEVVQLPDGWTAHVYRTARMPRLKTEARAVRAERVAPSVRVMARATLASLLEPWDETLAAHDEIRDDELDRYLDFARRQPPGRQRWRLLAARVARMVQHQHEGGPPGRPDAALQAGKGDRAALFHTLARRLGADACLVRVQPLVRDPAGEPPDPDDWGLEVVRLRLPDGELWYDPGLEGGLTDHLRAGLRRRPGLLVGCPQRPADPKVVLPALGEGQDKRDIDLVLDWHADGSVVARVTERLHGAPAELVRSLLLGASESGRTEVVQQLASGVLPGLRAELTDVDGAGQLHAPLTVQYELTGPADPARKSVLELGLWPDDLGQAYAGLAERHTRLLFGHALDNRVRATVRSLGGPVAAPDPRVDLRAGPVQFAREAQVDGQELTFVKSVKALPQVVEVEDYGELARVLRAIDAAEVVRLQR